MKNVWIVVAAAVALCSCATTQKAGTDAVERAANDATRQGEATATLAEEASRAKPLVEAMTNDEIHEILSGEVEGGGVQGLERQGPVWMFEYNGVVMVVVSDEASDRMRIVAPIVPVEELPDPRLLFILMEANFHTALDARYATSDGVVYSTFIHPLSSLTGDDFRSALSQVSSLVLTFGTTFSGTPIEHAEVWGIE